MDWVLSGLSVVKDTLHVNSATLSGAVDTIVVEQEDGTLKSTPFNVRFGKLQLLRSREKAVRVTVNGEVAPFSLKVNREGEAFFVRDKPTLSPALEPLRIGEVTREEPHLLLCSPLAGSRGGSSPTSDSPSLASDGLRGAPPPPIPGMSVGSEMVPPFLPSGGEEEGSDSVVPAIGSSATSMPPSSPIPGNFHFDEDEEEEEEEEGLENIGDGVMDTTMPPSLIKAPTPLKSEGVEEAGNSITPPHTSPTSPTRNSLTSPAPLVPRSPAVFNEPIPGHSSGRRGRSATHHVALVSAMGASEGALFSSGAASPPSFSPSPLVTVEEEKEKETTQSQINDPVDVLSDSMAMSLCGHILDPTVYGDRDGRGLLLPYELETFIHHKITWEMFCADPFLIYHPAMVFLVNGRILPLEVAAPYALSKLAFGRPLGNKLVRKIFEGPPGTPDEEEEETPLPNTPAVAPTRSRFSGLVNWLIPGRRAAAASIPGSYPGDRASRNTDAVDEVSGAVPTMDVGMALSVAGGASGGSGGEEEGGFSGSPAYPALSTSPTRKDSQKAGKKASKNNKTHYASFQPTDSELRSLQLNRGCNEVKFEVTSSLQGTVCVTARIFLLHHEVPLVISDIDGTITRSDALGHLLPLVGKDWSHRGVAPLYNSITDSGYQFMYLTSRAIGQASVTRNYLSALRQNGMALPEGPVIMSPDRLWKSFRREVITRRPEEFKIQALSAIRNLYPAPGPFYAGFGNRVTDAISYEAVGVPSSRIFIIDKSGHVQIHGLGTVSGATQSTATYSKIASLAVEIFPPIQYEEVEYSAEEEEQVDMGTTEVDESTDPPLSTTINSGSPKKKTHMRVKKSAKEEYRSINYWDMPLPDVDLPPPPKR